MSVVEKAIRKLQKQREQSAEDSQAQAASEAAEASQASDPAAQRASAAPTVSQPSVVLDRATLRSAGLLPPDEEIDLITRQYRKIKHPLVARAVGRNVPRESKGYLIMIASAMSGEGKSFTAMNLALSLSLEKDISVLLVDADAPKPHLTRVMGLTKASGLLDVLRDPQIDVESLVHTTNVRSLSFLPLGVGGDDATELLSSARMERLGALLGQRIHRIVVFDSPPLLQTTESPALARVAGQIVVVVRADSTPQPVLLDALNTLEGHHAEVSLVLNQSTQSGTAPYYYYGYDGKSGGPAPAAPADSGGGK